MDWGTYDAGAHTPAVDIMQRPVTNGQQEPVYEPRQTGGTPYTLARVGYGEPPAVTDATND